MAGTLRTRWHLRFDAAVPLAAGEDLDVGLGVTTPLHVELHAGAGAVEPPEVGGAHDLVAVHDPFGGEGQTRGGARGLHDTRGAVEGAPPHQVLLPHLGGDDLARPEIGGYEV